ncbi:MAG: recombination protein RecR [Spirochaetes bacterium]|nr:recombination protein RecR [Spirochaetota bacterium]
MSVPSQYLEKTIQEFSKLPGIGRKSASRIAFHLLGLREDESRALAQTIIDLKNNILFCRICGGISDQVECPICTDSSRDQSVLCVVENPKDVLNIEKSMHFKGRYHVLGGVISPLDGIAPEDLNIKNLLERCRNSSVKEIIIATNPTIEGDATSAFIAKLVKPSGIKVMRIARGIPVGSDLDYIDIATISRSIDERTEI